jgi:hypothetical protein
MGLRLVDEGSERGQRGDVESLSEARRSIGSTRKRLEELAERLRELGQRVGGGRAPRPGLDGPERAPHDDPGPGGSSSS